MDTKLKKYSHLITTKIVVFIIAILCFTGAMTAFANVAKLENDDFSVVFEDNYFLSQAYMQETDSVLMDLTRLIGEFKNEKNILSGKTLSEVEIRGAEEQLYNEFRVSSRNYNPNLNEVENYKKFQEEYAKQLAQAKDKLIKDDLKEYHLLLQSLEEHKDLFYYASDGVNVFTNSPGIDKGQFKAYPSYIIFENYKREFYPKEIKDNEHLYRITNDLEELDLGSSSISLAFTEEFLNEKTREWKEAKVVATNSLYTLALFLPGFILSFGYLLLVLGRKSFNDQELRLNVVDRLYNDLNILLCMMLIAMWAATMEAVDHQNISKMIIPVTIPLATVGLGLILSLVKHLKNGSFLKHTLIYTIIYKLFTFVRDVYNSGSIGIKVILLVIGYPILVGITWFMFPVTIGLAAWLAFKWIKSLNTLKEGVEKIKAGDLNHTIEVDGKGELGTLAGNINSITDGLKKAVDNELKSERLKTELLTNVSHDIRTPLTSIITYVDLMKKEKDPAKVAEYVEVLDQKSQRLKTLTEDLFEAAKASSGNIPVNLERIDLIALITQGLGELNDKIQALDLEFKINHPKDHVFIMADGKLLWRAIENLLSNIFKYALRGSRVYIDVENIGNEILLCIKNISAFELNISADELMERFIRGDESRSSQGSGLGLSIAKSLIDLQRGKFYIQVDGDLFKAMIHLPKN